MRDKYVNLSGKPLLRTVFQGWSYDREVAGFSYLFHFDHLPIGPIKIVCLQQEKWISEGKTLVQSPSKCQ
jgi:hypothetical protein